MTKTKDNNEKIQERLANLEKERKTLAEQLEDNESLSRIMRLECNEAKTKNRELTSENKKLKERYSNFEILLKLKDEELSDIKEQLDILWNQTHHLAALSPLPNLLPNISDSDLLELKELGTTNANTFNKTLYSDMRTCSCRKKNNRQCGKCGSENKSTNTKHEATVDATTNTTLPPTKCDASSNTLHCGTLDAESNTETEVADMNSNNRSVCSPPDQESNDKCVNTSPLHRDSYTSQSATDIMDAHNLERMRTLLIAELTSLQLLHSMFDLTISSITNNKSKDSTHVHITNPSLRVFGGSVKEVDRQSSSTPSGYETGSHRGSQVDILGNPVENHRTVTPEYLRFSDDNKPDTFDLDSLEPKFKCASSVSSSDMMQHSPTKDKVSMLYIEIDNQRKAIDGELIKIVSEMLGEKTLKYTDGLLRKRDVYRQLVQILNDPIASSNFNIDQLEQILNLVLVDHSITGCLLTLSHRNHDDNAEEILHRLSTFDTVPESSIENISPADDDYYDYENGGAEIDTVDDGIPYVDPSDLTAALTTMQVVSDNEMSDCDDKSEISPTSDEGSPTLRKKGIRRFFCVSVRSLRRPKKCRKVY